jgi:hypothetical protein
MKISIVIIATNIYFLLGMRFVKKFAYHYKGNYDIDFHIYSDRDPSEYLPGNIKFYYHHQTHAHWHEGTNSKFSNILNLNQYSTDYIYYFDADTDISHQFTESWFLGDIVGGEHYGNRSWLSNCKGLDRNPIGQSYVPLDSNLPCTYYYGAFFGGKKQRVIDFCSQLRHWQSIDQSIGYEPPVNDESYINKYFHLNPPSYTVPSDKFAFITSCKGGLDNHARFTNTDITNYLNDLKNYKDYLIGINHQIITKLAYIGL